MNAHDYFYNKLAFSLLLGVLLVFFIATVALADNLNLNIGAGGTDPFMHRLLHAISNSINRIEIVSQALVHWVEPQGGL